MILNRRFGEVLVKSNRTVRSGVYSAIGVGVYSEVDLNGGGGMPSNTEYARMRVRWVDYARVTNRTSHQIQAGPYGLLDKAVSTFSQVNASRVLRVSA